MSSMVRVTRVPVGISSSLLLGEIVVAIVSDRYRKFTTSRGSWGGRKISNGNFQRPTPQIGWSVRRNKLVENQQLTRRSSVLSEPCNIPPNTHRSRFETRSQ